MKRKIILPKFYMIPLLAIIAMQFRNLNSTVFLWKPLTDVNKTENVYKYYQHVSGTGEKIRRHYLFVSLSTVTKIDLNEKHQIHGQNFHGA